MTQVSALRPALPIGRTKWFRWSVFAVTFGFLTYYALHHGSYSLIDRQTNAVILWVMIGAGAAFGIFPAVRQPRVAWLPFFALLAMAVWTLVALNWTESAERTFNEFARILGYLGVVGLVLLTVGRRSWRMAAAGLLTAGVLVCCLTLLSRLWPSIFPVDTVSENFGTSRISYPFGYWNAVGCWCAMTITLCLSFSAHARSWIVKALALAAVPICAVPLYLAVSRASLGGILVGLILLLAFSQYRWLLVLHAGLAAIASSAVLVVVRGQPEIVEGVGTSGSWNILAALLLAGIAVALVTSATHRFDLGPKLKMGAKTGRATSLVVCATLVIFSCILISEFGGRAVSEFRGESVAKVSSPEDRLSQLNGNRHNLWFSGVEAFESQPLTGIGPGSYEFWWSRNGVNGEFVRDVHNLYLEALAEVGIVGLLLLLAFSIGLFTSAIKGWLELRNLRIADAGIAAGLIATFGVFSFQAGLDWMWESTAVAVFALVSGTVCASLLGASRFQITASLSVGGTLMAALAALILLPGLTNQRKLEQSQDAYRDRNLPVAVAAASAAIDSAPWSASAYAQRSLVFLADADTRAARQDIQTSMDKEPTNWRWPFVALRIAIREGDEAEAAHLYREARRLRKFSETFGSKGPPYR